jgi:hypothetical protein
LVYLCLQEDLQNLNAAQLQGVAPTLDGHLKQIACPYFDFAHHIPPEVTAEVSAGRNVHNIDTPAIPGCHLLEVIPVEIEVDENQVDQVTALLPPKALLQQLEKTVLAKQRLVAQLRLRKQPYETYQLPLQLGAKFNVPLQRVFETLVDGHFQKFFEIADEADGALELGLRGILDEGQVL